MPFASVNASSCAALAPASRMWYPEIEIVLKRRQPLGAVREEVGREPHRRSRREDVVASRDVLLQHVVLHGAAELLPGDALALGDELVEQEEQRGRGVDRHRGRDLAERDPVEQRLHVAERVDRDAGPADLALCDAGRRSRSRAASGGRTRRRARSARARAGSGSARSSPPPTRTPRTGGSSTDVRGTSCRRGRA